jgi:hypothetical protein
MNNFFYDLNKRLAQLASKQDLNESKVAESEKWIQKAVNPKTKGNLHKALHVAQDETIPKAKIEKATHSKNPKLRHMAQFAKNVAHEDIEQEGNAFTGALKATPKGGKFKVGGKEFKDTSSIEEGQCPKCAPSPCSCNEGNAFTGKLNSTAKGDKFKLGKKEFTDTSSIEEGFKEMDAWMASREKEKGTGKFDRKERTLPGGMKATTYTRKHEDDKEDDSDAPEDKGGAPKKKGRPMGKPKGPERITKGAWKHKAGRKEKTKEDLDTDGVMMTRPTNCSSESIENPGEYDQEGAMAKGDMHTVIRHAEQLEQHLQDAENLPTWVIEKLGQIKGMMTSVSDYIISSHERGAEQATGQEGIRMGEGWRGGMHGEPSVVKTGKKDPNAKVEAWNGLMAIVARGQGMEPAVLKHLKQIARTLKPEELELDEEKVEAGKREFFDRLAPAAKKAAKVIKAIAKNRTPVEEESTGKEDTKAERAGKKVTKDIEYDDKKNKTKKVDEFFDNQVTVKGGDARTAGGNAGVSGVSSTGGSSGASNSNKNSATGGAANSNSSSKADANANANADSKNEEKVEETTVAGSVAPAQNAAPKGTKGMQFGKGVYESYNRQFTQALNESISIESKMQECGDGNMEPGITITADGEEAAKLMMLLKLAGLENQIPKACPSCGGSPCGCSEVVDENSPDWPTNTETLAADPNLRTYSGGLNGPKSTGQSTTPVLASQLRRQASMEESVALERNLFKTWQNYKG